MASTYYGTTGQNVIKLQQELNKLGAGLKVDGVWGDHTEAAYNQYAPQVKSSGAAARGSSMSSGAEDYLSDDYIRQLAQTQANTQYQNDLLSAQQQSESRQQLLDQAKERLKPQYEEQRQTLSDSYGKANQAISDAALSRGMGRSSHLIDRQAESLQNQVNDEQKLMAGYQANVQAYDDQISLLMKQLNDTKGQLSQKLQSDITGLVNQLTGEREKAKTELQKYQDDQAYKQAKLQLERDKLDQNYKLQMLKLGAKSRSGGGSGSRGSGGSSKSASKSAAGGSSSVGSAYTESAGSGASKNSILNEWNRLTDAGKLKYIQDNKAKIAKLDVSLYNRLKKQADNISKKGSITATPTKYYNYYKDQKPYKLYSGGR